MHSCCNVWKSFYEKQHINRIKSKNNYFKRHRERTWQNPTPFHDKKILSTNRNRSWQRASVKNPQEHQNSEMLEVFPPDQEWTRVSSPATSTWHCTGGSSQSNLIGKRNKRHWKDWKGRRTDDMILYIDILRNPLKTIQSNGWIQQSCRIWNQYKNCIVIYV